MFIEDYGYSIRISVDASTFDSGDRKSHKANLNDFDDMLDWVGSILPAEPEGDVVYNISVALDYHGEGVSNTRMTVLSMRGFTDKLHYIIGKQIETAKANGTV